MDVVIRLALVCALGRGTREDRAMRPQQTEERGRHAGDKEHDAHEREAIVQLVFRGVAVDGQIGSQESRAAVEPDARECLEDDVGDGDVTLVETVAFTSL